MKTELHNYDIFPKVLPAGKTSSITIKPLGWHAAFKRGANYKLAIHPVNEGHPDFYTDRRNKFVYEVQPDEEGCIRFEFDFFSEQQYFIDILDDEYHPVVQLCVYAILDDLVGRYPLRGDLHLHSKGSDGLQAPEIMCAYYRKTGYDFLAITDHRRYYPSLDAIRAYSGIPIELAIIPGEEIHLPAGSEREYFNEVHIVNFGGEYSINALIEGEHFYHTYREGETVEPRSIVPDCPDTMTKEEYWKMVNEYAKNLDIPQGIEKFQYASCHWIFNEIRKANGLGILCHPYWVIATGHQVPPDFTEYMMKTQPFDAYEVLGGGLNFEWFGIQALSYYEDRIKGRVYPIVGSTDSHSSFDNNSSHVSSTIVFAEKNDRTHIIDAIKSFYSVAVDSRSHEWRYVGDLRLVKYACFLEKEFFPLHDDLCYEEGRAMKDYICGVSGAAEILKCISGRVQKQREKYFKFTV